MSQIPGSFSLKGHSSGITSNGRRVNWLRWVLDPKSGIQERFIRRNTKHKTRTNKLWSHKRTHDGGTDTQGEPEGTATEHPVQVDKKKNTHSPILVVGLRSSTCHPCESPGRYKRMSPVGRISKRLPYCPGQRRPEFQLGDSVTSRHRRAIRLHNTDSKRPVCGTNCETAVFSDGLGWLQWTARRGS